MPTLVVIIAFLVILGLVWLAIGFGLKFWEEERKKKVEGMLKAVSGEAPAAEPKSLVKPSSEVSQFEELANRSPFLRGLKDRIRQADLNWSLSGFLAMTLVFAVIGAVIGSRIRVLTLMFSLLLACAFAVLPYVHVMRKRKQRLGMFEKQFPEALDFLARALRAGHAFTSSLEMLAAESVPPLGPEFRRLYDEQNLGAPLDTALRNLAVRMPLIDVRFFVSAVLLQRQTGGNLGEILRNLSRVIRERFQLKGQVRAMSAHGRITAAVLTVLPIVTVLGLMLIAPDFIGYLAKDEDGKYLIAGSVIGMISGYYFMRKITNIKI